MKAEILRAEENPEFFCGAEIFLRRNEKFLCVLMEEVLKKSGFVHVIFFRGEVKGVFYFSAGGTFFGDVFFCAETESALREFFSDKKIFCVLGEKKFAEKILGLLFESKKIRPSFVREMFLMEFPFEKFSDISGESCGEENFRVKKCGVCDTEKILPLHFLYLDEEVLPPGKKTFPPAERLALEKSAREGKIFALENLGEFCSMARISSETDSFVQIGGVFTKSPFRKKGFASVVVKKILRESRKKNKATVLFADKKNSAAVSLYKKSGFEIFGEMVIAYFGLLQSD